MRKQLIFAIWILLLLPASYAWRWDTHKMFVENFYNNVPLEVQEKLNLSLMKSGSIVPDEVFHDNIRHHYPPSLPLAEAWLEAAREEYHFGNYKNASLAFGIAVHYITDSFAAPHYSALGGGKAHSNFEAQADYYVPKAKCGKSQKSLKEFLEEGSKNQDDMAIWVDTNDKKIPEAEVEEAMGAVFSVGLETFGTECKKLTLFEKLPFRVTPRLAIAVVIGVIIIAAIIMYPTRKPA